ncbi:aminopeptidase P N-terminal domain-containing protein [Accumulibacter sp.]|uniref:aminopeptidase P N-terminal domain-containing protein n=1 Tax=Accumulibacter sp. TaxID=2053492 RepID=UPI00261B6A7D|nr:aminopeptidase P N-terminal domain-containing protein [Accumulibacter sp.]HRD94294.1 aminopeptidase P N-terminal domain-containing protein [Accumulibacter sp.]
MTRPPLPMTHAPYSSRRQRLLDSLGDGVAVLATAPERVRNSDSHYPYRFDSYFWYLSGFPEPEAAIVLVGGREPKSLLFCRDKDEERETWDGFRYGPEAAAKAFGFSEAHPIASLEQKLPELIANRGPLWHSLGHDADWDQRITRALNAIRNQSRSGSRAPGEIRDLRGLLDQMRLIKDDHEIKSMRRAAEIASAGHSRAMRACRPGMAEYELEAEIGYEFRRRGADGHAYTPIVAGGANACILHYVANNKLLAGQSLVLIDAGCEVDGYASDITRTFPVGGRFSPVQREVYEVVLAAQQAALAAVRPGALFTDYHQAALRVLVQGLIDLKVLAGSVDGAIESEAYKPWYMHRTGHWLGLDVHDAGEYKTGIADDAWVKLLPGMTLTVEPGLYFRPGSRIPQHLHGLGVRIEDDVLVTADGCAVYTNAPKTIAEIEEVMRHD